MTALDEPRQDSSKTSYVAELAVIPNADHSAVATSLFWNAVEDFLSRNI
jgi:hypothetical protein